MDVFLLCIKNISSDSIFLKIRGLLILTFFGLDISLASSVIMNH